jgi:hypothetical protein
MRNSVLLSLLFVAGCVGHADVMIPHPLTGHAISPEETAVEKPQGFIETSNGLPIGTLTEKAKITRLDEAQACFAVEMHSLNAEFANIRGLDTVLKAQPSGEKAEGATITNTRTSTHVYEGLVAHQVPTGSEEYCAHRDPSTNGCDTWRTRTLYATTMIPGPVTVYDGSADVCFSHGGVVTKQSQRIILDLHKVTMVGFMPQKTGIDFRWGFSGFSTAKGSSSSKADKAETTQAPSDAETDAKFDALMASKDKAKADEDDAPKPAPKSPKARARRAQRKAVPAET